MKRRLVLVMSLAALMVVGMVSTALAAVNTDATGLVTSTAADIEDTALAIVPLVLAAVLAIGLALWGIRFVLRKFGIRTSG